MTHGSLPNRLNVDTRRLSPVGNVRDVSDKSGVPLYFGWTLLRKIINVDMQNECRMNQHIFFNFRKNNGTRNISRSGSFNNAATDFSEVTSFYILPWKWATCWIFMLVTLWTITYGSDIMVLKIKIFVVNFLNDDILRMWQKWPGGKSVTNIDKRVESNTASI